MVLDGQINGLSFQAYVDQVLIPEQARRHRDHGHSHKDAPVRAAIEAAGASFSICRPTAPTSIR
jgi:hypothetical protein